MIYDFTSDKDKLLDNYDACICGAGAAGITIALQLSAAGKSVLLLEAGGINYTPESQEKYNGSASGVWNDYPLGSTRLRFLGGTTNHWAGRCKPFLEFDFENHLDFGHGLPGWPISFAEVNKYLDPALDILDVDPATGLSVSFDTKLKSKSYEPDFDAKSAPTRFGQKYKDTIASDPNIALFLNANVVDLASESKGSLSHVLVLDYAMEERKIKASNYIVAMGAIENARMLLLSDKTYKNGPGNGGDMIGRCFMEHYNVEMGEFMPDPKAWQGREGMSFYPTVEFMKDSNVGGSNVMLRILGEEGTVQSGRLGPIRQIIQDLACEYDLSEELQFLVKHTCGGSGVVTTLTEQSPNKASRVSLTDDLDAFKLRKAHLHIEMSEFDKSTIRKLAKRMASDIADLGIGRMKLPDYILDESKDIVSWPHAHHMGTTRMAESEEFGVVDSNSKVFGVDNLYMAGASVFSTGGGNNPTLPLVQLSLRLADHLLENLGSS